MRGLSPAIAPLDASKRVAREPVRECRYAPSGGTWVGGRVRVGVRVRVR